MISTQLLCTFCNAADLKKVCNEIQKKYKVVSDKVFVLENVNEANQLILTYNVFNVDLNNILESTISVHRKKQSNTIYTINALNKLIIEKNNGILDKNYKIDWDELRNVVLVTAYGKLKTISTRIKDIVVLEN